MGGGGGAHKEKFPTPRKKDCRFGFVSARCQRGRPRSQMHCKDKKVEELRDVALGAREEGPDPRCVAKRNRLRNCETQSRGVEGKA